MNVAPYRKFVVALSAALGLLVTAIGDGDLNTSEIITVLLGFLASYGVWRVPNVSDTTVPTEYQGR